jgi:hypothetical protein
MRNESKRLHRVWFVALGLLIASTPLRAQTQDIRANAKADLEHVTLADWVQVTVTIEGPAPLRVELPKQLLTDDANRAWRIRADKDEPKITPTTKGREEWRRVYRLNAWPTLDGTWPAIAFAPFTVNGQQATLPAIKVTVNRIGGPSAPAMPKAQPRTDIEDVPTRPIDPPQPSVWPWVAGATLLMCVFVLLAARMRSRKATPVPPGEWALAALAKLEAGESLGAEAVERVAEIVRKFIQRRFTIPATKMTTTELLAATAQQGWSVEETDALRVVLDECDRVKFARDVPDDDGCRRLMRLTIEWINHISRPVEPR